MAVTFADTIDYMAIQPDIEVCQTKDYRSLLCKSQAKKTTLSLANSIVKYSAGDYHTPTEQQLAGSSKLHRLFAG